MAITNQDRVGKAMDLLKQGLGPFVEREFKNSYGATALSEVKRILGAAGIVRHADRPLGRKSLDCPAAGRHLSGIETFPGENLAEQGRATGQHCNKK